MKKMLQLFDYIITLCRNGKKARRNNKKNNSQLK